MQDLNIFQQLYSKVFLIGQRHEDGIIECVGDCVVCPSSGFMF